MKRAFDIAVSAASLLVLLPVMTLLAIGVRLDSRGPAFYGQRRVGRNGKPFTLWKFRTMRHGSSQAVHVEAARRWFEGRPAGELKSVDDPRITRAGRYLRRSNLDELPQLVNVLKGEMSLVGPRPGMHYERPMYQGWYFEREAVRPGITGLWQVSGRHRLSAAQMMRLDVHYVRERSMWFDLKILARTIPTLLEDVRAGRERRRDSTAFEEVALEQVTR